jgi:hypothetical protein
MLPRAVTESFLGWDVGLSVAERERVHRDVVAFVRAEIALAPAHIRFVLRVLAGTFAAWIILTRLAGIDVAAAIAAWSHLTGPPGGMLIRLLRSLALLAFGEHPLVRARLGEPSVTALQSDRRLARMKEIA